MVRFLADEDFHGAIVRGIRRQRPDLDIVTVHDVGLTGAQDPVVLELAAREGRILLTHDVNTMIAAAYRRVEAGLSLPGVFAVSQSVPVGQVIEDILLLAECSIEGEWEGQVRRLP